MRVVAYTRVSTREQAEDGHGLDAQRAAIRREIELRGWELVDFCEDEGLSGASLKGRNELVRAVRMIEDGKADVLMATKIDRVSRSVADFADLLRRAEMHKWVLVVLDIGLDLTKPTGKFVAHIMSAVAELERGFISERTKEGLAAARDKGTRLGAPPGVSDALSERIARMHFDDGMTLVAIADQLNTENVPTGRGGKRWWPSTVGAVVNRMKKETA
jgi:DNA invertase Pin-like site-specific DNA recombinase